MKSPYLDKIASLTPQARHIISEQATEDSHSGRYNSIVTQGTYLCRRCGLALFRANSQFASGCGWPSFDITIPNTVKELPNLYGPDILLVTVTFWMLKRPSWPAAVFGELIITYDKFLEF